MACTLPQPVFAKPTQVGLKLLKPSADGYTVFFHSDIAYSPSSTYQIGWNVYYSTNRNDVFSEGTKFFSPNNELNISVFTPGNQMYGAMRATLHDPTVFDLKLLPRAGNLAEDAYVYPDSMLSSNITDSDVNIPLVDSTDFPDYGVIQVGVELIRYFVNDRINSIIRTTLAGRGYYNTTARMHTVDGYDGYSYTSPIVKFYPGYEDQNEMVLLCDPRFEPPYFPFTEADGYRRVDNDILTTDLTTADNTNLNVNDCVYSGYRQTSMIDYFGGKCIGSYHGQNCYCGDDKIITRGVNFQDIMMQRETQMLEVTGEPVVLLRRLWEGIRCNCFRNVNEAPEGRCPICFGTGFITGYEQYFYPKRSDGRILVRFSPVQDDLAYKAHGLEQTLAPDCWTNVPIIKDRDVLIRFNEDGTREFMYEVLNVTRNKTLFSLSGAQKFNTHRLDKTDIVYQWRAINDTSRYPYNFATTIGILRGHGPHMHNIRLSEKVSSLNQINQTTSIMMGHNHYIVNGIVKEELGHTHEIIMI